jgi:ComF family protein
MFSSILQIIFPNLCISCNKNLIVSEKYLCLGCQLILPETNDHLKIENGVEKTLWGRIPFERAFSFLFFNKLGTTQKLLHELKYNGNEELAEFLGQIYAHRIKQTVENQKIDAIIAIPLHASKLKKRGYNQSFAFSKGISEELNMENLSDFVIRNKATDTQTKKSRQERWSNVSDIFSVNSPEKFENKHILIVDDVITTGATIESCANVIINNCNCRISVASIAFAA